MRVFCYLRVSTRDQIDGYSLAAQERALRDYCTAHGWDAPTLWTDAGRSGYTDITEQRPQFAAMLHEAEAGGCDVVLVHKLDRFARSLITTLRELRRLERAGVGFISLSESMDFSTPIGRVILSVLAAFAEYFSANLSREAKKGLAERAAAGYPPPNLPYGARLGADGKTLEVDPARATALAALLELVATVSYFNAALALNAAGYPARRGGAWRPSSVREVVRSGGWLATQPAPWPELHRAAAARLTVAAVRADRRTYALTGLMRCGHCGRSLTYQPRPQRPPNVRCQMIGKGERCGGPRHLPAAHYEALVSAWLAALPDDQYLADLAERADAAADPAAAAWLALHTERERLGLAYADGLLPTATYAARKADLDARARALPARTTSATRWLGELAALRSNYTALPPEAQNRALRALVDELVIVGDHLTVTPHPDLARLLALAHNGVPHQ